MAGFLPSRSGRFRERIDSAVLDKHLTGAIAELQPQPAGAGEPKPTEGKSMATNPADAGLSVKALLEDHKRMMGEIHQAQVQLLAATLAKQRDTVTGAIGSVARQIDSQTEDFKAIMGQFTNDLGSI